MASTIRIKRSATAGSPSTLGLGELAYSALTDNGANGGDRLYIGTGTETAGNASGRTVIGGKFFTDSITAATNLNTASTLVRRDASGNFSAGTITATLTGSATSLATGRTISLTGDVTYTSGSFDGTANVTGAATLANTAVTAGSYGSSTAIPTFTVDSKGRLTAASTAAISTTLALNAGGSTTATVVLGTDNLTFTSTSGITTSIVKASTTATLTIGIDSTVATLTGTQTLTNKTLSTGSTWLGNTIAVTSGGTGTVNGSITGTGALTFTAGGTNTNVNLVPNGTGMVDVGGKRVGNAADPTQSSDLATKNYVDAVKTGLDPKDSARIATTATLTATYVNGTSGVGATLTNSGTQAAFTVDSIVGVAGDRVLVKDQATALQNGLYIITTVGTASTNWVLTRAIDADQTAEVTPGAFTFVEEGTVNASNGFVCTTTGTITIGTTNITWVQFSGAGQITSGAGLTKSGNTLDVVGTANRISVFTDNIDIAATYVGQTSLTTLGTVTTGTWNATVLAGTYGGTGVNNGSNTITLGGNFLSAGSVTHAGAFAQTFTATGTTSITLPTTGTLATLAGTETLTNKTIIGSVISGGTGAFTTISASGNVTLSANLTGAGAGTSTIDGFQIDGGTY